jgi:hypothetical protein
MKNHIAAFTLACILLFAIGCIHRQGSTQPVTPYEQVMVWNDALAQTNNHIARGIIEVSPSLIAPEKAVIILREQRNIAAIDEQITTLLKQGPDVAKLNSSNLQAFLDQLKQSVKNLIDSGAIGTKNPATQKTFDADIQTVGSLADNILRGLRQSGVIQ